MSSWRSFCETVHLAALGIWLGFVGATAAFAATVFPAVRELDPQLPAYASYTGEHWRIAGGAIAQRIFLLADLVQFICALLATSALGALVGFLGLERRRPATIVRTCALAIALACAAGSIIIVAPQLNAAIRLYWAAAQQGNLEAVALHRSAIDQLHPIASRLMGGTIVCVFIAFITGLWAIARPWRSPDAAPAPTSRYEEPALLRARGRRT